MPLQEMLIYTETVLRGTLTRLTVDVTTLSRLVQVTSSLYRRSEQEASNPIIMALFETLGELLRLKPSLTTATTGTLAEVMITTQAAGTPLMVTHHSLFQGLAGPGLHFLFNFQWAWGDGRSNQDFAVSLTVAKLVLTAASRDRAVMVRMSEQGTEVGALEQP